jgi:hypothetical protein
MRICSEAEVQLMHICSEAEVQLMRICSDQEQVCLVPSRTKYSGWKGNEQAIGGLKWLAEW